ncbi:MAG: hypothetical protein ACRCYR_15790 [Phycicoccus sp.]
METGWARHGVTATRGGVLVEASATGEQVLSVEVDLDVTTAYRESFPVLADRRL